MRMLPIIGKEPAMKTTSLQTKPFSPCNPDKYFPKHIGMCLQSFLKYRNKSALGFELLEYDVF